MLRDSDRDRYLACLLSPEEKRGALAALYAFNAELARIRDLVHEPLPGEVRLQYWHDLLEGSAHGSTAANPVAAALLIAIETHRLPRKTLIDMIEARTFDLYDDPMETRLSLEGYAGETASALIQLASLVLSPEEAARSADAAGHAGVAQAVAGLLLLMPLHRRRGQIYIPLQILSATGLDRDAFLAGKTGRASPPPSRLLPASVANIWQRRGRRGRLRRLFFQPSCRRHLPSRCSSGRRNGAPCCLTGRCSRRNGAANCGWGWLPHAGKSDIGQTRASLARYKASTATL